MIVTRTLTPQAAKIIYDHAAKRWRFGYMPADHRRHGDALYRYWLRCALQSRPDYIRDYPMYVSKLVTIDGVEVPEVDHNVWVAYAVMRLGEPVDVFFEKSAPGQTYGPPVEPKIVGRGASVLPKGGISLRTFAIVNRSGQDYNAPEWFEPNSGRAHTLSALLTSINRWGHHAPNVFTPDKVLSVPQLTREPRKLTVELLDRELPLENGMPKLLKLRAAIDDAFRFSHRSRWDAIEALEPITPSALVWACYAQHPLDPTGSLAGPPIREWLLAAVHGKSHDDLGASTAGLLALRKSLAVIVSEKKPKRADSPVANYKTLALQVVQCWIDAMVGRNLKPLPAPLPAWTTS